jgi:hypothetical protein
VDIDMTDLRQVAADLAQLREDVDYLLLLLEPSLAGPAGPAGAAASPAYPAASTAPKSGVAHVWRTLTPTEAAHAWDTLTGWVDWLVNRYSLDDTLPACWYRHGPMVDELDALRASWVAAYLDPAARPTDSAYWLDLLHRTLDRIGDWDRYGCAAGTHHDDSSSSDPGHYRQIRDDFVFADVNARAAARRRQTSRSAESSDGEPADAG